MTSICYILAPLLVLGQIAGQIYLISKIIRLLTTEKIFLKSIIGMLAFALINIPAFIATYAVPPHTVPPYHISVSMSLVIVFFAIWVAGISFFGIGCFVNDYWQLYKSRGAPPATSPH